MKRIKYAIVTSGLIFLLVHIPIFSYSQDLSVIDLQQFREISQIAVDNKKGRSGKATLINLNPKINTWFLLRLKWDDGQSDDYHLENREPIRHKISLNPANPYGLMIVTDKDQQECDLWSHTSPYSLGHARTSKNPYTTLCQGQLYLRNKTEGHKTNIEYVTDLLRNYVWKGDKIVALVREKFYKDSFLITPQVTSSEADGKNMRRRLPSGPIPPLINPQFINNYIDTPELGIALQNEDTGKMIVGRWYQAKDFPGIFISALQPKLIAEEVIENVKNQINSLDDVELSALVYMIAFDLDSFDVGFAMGTEHPSVGWSERVQDKVLDTSLKGPDGIGTVDPLIMTGMVNPDNAARVAATFIGGFKRYHGAFRYGELAFKNQGSHYGFIEAGTVLSRLQPGLATVIIYDDGRVDLKTWTEQDNENMAHINYARQNGVPIIEYDEKAGLAKPGALVSNWGQGNWSGSADKRYRTLRAGLCVQESGRKKFLIYGYFTSVTTAAMVQVFQAYRCKYAMLLDINALEHTYLSVLRIEDSQFMVQHLIKGMSVLDKNIRGHIVPRFVGFPDNRDFFYLMRKGEEK
ncbi:MAG: hypothetical protein ACMUIP_08335 [bacterium]